MKQLHKNRKELGTDSSKTCCPISEKYYSNPYLSSRHERKPTENSLKMRILTKQNSKINKIWRKYLCLKKKIQ
ncbi:hypothetical protein [Methanosarcina siciliae]|uniref:hypothetical protein n=1 Tax=Methanosarcina siciliae TaxID=38027 RepID=UPI000A85A97B|nr:hypothetical protein [Methanosarcina siciliae]